MPDHELINNITIIFLELTYDRSFVNRILTFVIRNVKPYSNISSWSLNETLTLKYVIVETFIGLYESPLLVFPIPAVGK